MLSSRAETARILKLALPVVLTQVATMLMGVVDTMMVGKLGTAAMAATALGSVWVWGTLVVGLGVLMGIDPIVSQANGARDGRRAGIALQRGLLLAFVLSLPTFVLWSCTEGALVALGQEPTIARDAAAYVRVQSWSLPFFFAYSVLRQYLTGRGIVAPAMWVAWIANAVNVLLNWALIFGHLGFAAGGIVGAGTATALSRAFMLALLVALTLGGRLHRGGWGGWSRQALRPRGLLEVVRLGVPVGIQMALEVWAFHTATLLAGVIGAAALAGHAIALNLASLSFMVPFGISMAAATRVGNLIGAGQSLAAQRSAQLALALGASVMAVSAAAFVALRWQIPRLYHAAPDVLAAAAAVLPIAAAFQIFDGTQAVGCGVLRGMGAARLTAWINLAGYWAIGLPIGAWLAFERDMGLAGLWWGLTLGLLIVALALVVKIVRRGPAHALPLVGAAL